MTNNSTILRAVAGAFLLAVAGGAVAVHLHAARNADTGVLGLKKVIAFTYSPTKDFDLKRLHSATFVGPLGAGDWKDWRSRGVVVGVGHTWTDLLRSPLDKAVDALVGQDYGGNPQPVVMIDEFGFDYGGNMDQKSARVLRQTKLKKPDLSLAVFDMRGPIPQVLAETYRDVADLVMLESYVGSYRQYWWIATQVWSARKYGILPKTIVILGVGKGGNPGEDWAETKEELEQQIRFVRLIAPESPGVGFFGGTPELLTSADALCEQFSHIPTNGSGLPADVRAVAQTFTRRYAKPTLVVSPSFVEPNYTEDGKGMADPKAMRAYIINLGDEDAQNVKVRLRNLPNLGGNVFAEGVVPLIPRQGEAIAVLPVTDLWREWVGQWIVEVDAPGCDVLSFKIETPAK
ncbi:MAG: hypothetical protein P4N24_04190 [Acidobacteriota bacterium]|nr:hypothetical protein [Acidobacteriota bacterium]